MRSLIIHRHKNTSWWCSINRFRTRTLSSLIIWPCHAMPVYNTLILYFLYKQRWFGCSWWWSRWSIGAESYFDYNNVQYLHTLHHIRCIRNDDAATEGELLDASEEMHPSINVSLYPWWKHIIIMWLNSHSRTYFWWRKCIIWDTLFRYFYDDLKGNIDNLFNISN